MQASEIQALMTTHRVFGALPDGTRQALASQAQVQAFQADDIVLAESELPERLGWLLAGSVALTDPEAGWRWPLQPGELFGAGAHPTDAGHPLHAVAVAPSQVLFIDSAALVQAVHQYR